VAGVADYELHGILGPEQVYRVRVPESSEQNGLHMVRRDEPKAHSVYPRGSQAKPTVELPERDAPEPFGFFTVGRIGFVVAIALFFAFVIGSGYLIRQLHREAGIAEETHPPSPTATEAPTQEAWVSLDMIHVTSIALGNVPLAIVNGQRVSEGDLLEVKTPAGPATLRVVGIEDGTVHFKYGSQIIDAKWMAPPTPTKPR